MRLDRLLPAVALLTGSFLVAAPASAEDDTTPPVITIDAPQPTDEFTRGDGVTVVFSCVDESDPNPTCEGLLGGESSPAGPIASGDGRSLDAADTYTLSVSTVDASGNSDTASVVFTADDLLCRGQVVTVILDIGEDPTAGADVIQGRLGSAAPAFGLGGNDRICAGAGPVEGGGGNDTIYGTVGSDYLFGGAGNDRIEGGAGYDRIEGDEGTDTLLGGADADRIEGGAGNDAVNGGAARDVCLGQEGTRDTKAQCEVATGFP
jgi:hypothetical protein